jgi:hypothetical protein
VSRMRGPKVVTALLLLALVAGFIHGLLVMAC